MKLLGKLLLVVMLPVVLFADPIVYLNDNFNDNDRSNESLPGSGAWYRSFNNLSTVEVSPGNYALQNAPTTTTIRHAVTYFTGSGSPASLSSGQKITLAFDLTPTTANPADALNVLRVGLLNSGSQRVSGDNDNPNLTLDGGYALFFNPNDARAMFYGRTGDAGVLFSSLSAGGGWVDSDDDPSTGGFLADATAVNGFAMVQNTKYSFNVDIERLSSGNVSLTCLVSDGVNSYSVSHEDSEYKNYDFDTVGFAWGSAFGTGLIDNVNVSVVPEPATIGMLGVGAVAISLFRRRISK